MYMNRKLQAQEKLVCKKGKTSEQQECALRLEPVEYPQFSFLLLHTCKTHSHSLYEKTTVM